MPQRIKNNTTPDQQTDAMIVSGRRTQLIPLEASGGHLFLFFWAR